MATLAPTSLVISVISPSKGETAREIRSNCRAALREMDIAICADPARLDADIAMDDAVRILLDSRDDENFRAALLADQRGHPLRGLARETQSRHGRSPPLRKDLSQDPKIA